jgi:H+/gluconate symporter-like permease
VVMLLSLAIASYTLGVARKTSISSLMETYGAAVKDIALILLIVAGAGALRQIFVESGASQDIAASLEGISLNPLILGWFVALVIRVCLGSATVAGLTAAGIVAPLVLANPEINPNLMVLAIGSGSLMCSHVNDSGFWLYKEYFNLSLKETFMSWTLMETLVGLVGLVGVLLLDLLV